MVPLTSSKRNQLDIQKFSANKQGKGLEKYLKECAWEEDINGGTKVYLVKDRRTGVIVFFFALQAGLLYKAIGDDDFKLTEQEQEIVSLCVEYQLNPDDSNPTMEEVFGWYDDASFDKERLAGIIESRVNIKLAVKEDQKDTDEGINIMRVMKTFPGIVLTQFCKNEEYSLPEKLLFPLGFYVFWEIVVDQVMYISSLLGCQYLYLFAADNTSSDTNISSSMDFLYGDLDENDDNSIVQKYKLVEYYKNELKFEDIQGMTILKPYYDFSCFSLIQAIDQLSDNKNAAWIQHSDIEAG